MAGYSFGERGPVVTRAFTEQLHPRGTGAVGGQFVAGGASKTAPAGKAKPRATNTKDGGGNLSFDGKRGAGYGAKGGDKRVKTLQTALNKLGLTDGSGKELAVDGKLGPRTTAAIKKAQRKLGLKPDGVVTPALLRQLAATKSAKDLKPAAKKAVPAKKAAPAKKEPPRYTKAAKAKPMQTIHRSVRYSGLMTEDLERHGTHNQKSHGNRLGKPSNVAAKTGLGKATAALAEKPELGPSRAPARKDFTAADILKVLGGDRPAFMGVSRKNEDHLKILEDAGADPEQARQILKDLGGNPDRPWETKDVGYSLQHRADSEARAKAEGERTEKLAAATPAAFARLLGTDGKPALVKSKPVVKVFESMQANGWKMTAARPEASSYTFSSADGGKVIQVLAYNSVSIYDERHNKISGVKALAYIEGT